MRKKFVIISRFLLLRGCHQDQDHRVKYNSINTVTVRVYAWFGDRALALPVCHVIVL